MKIFSITICSNEVDIIEDTILHHQSIFDNLYIWNIGIDEHMTSILDRLSNEYDNLYIKNEVRQFSDDLRAELYNEIKGKYSEKDWYYQLDSDEFLHSNIRRFIKEANFISADYLRTNHFNFGFTFEDKKNNIQDYKQLKYYTVAYSEIRAFRNRKDLIWPIDDRSILPLGLIVPINIGYKVYPIFINIYHFPSRSFEQIEKRIKQKIKLVNSIKYKEVEGIDYSKYRMTDPNKLISDCKNLYNSLDDNFNNMPDVFTRLSLLNKFAIIPIFKSFMYKILKR